MTNATVERARTNANRLAKRFTKFITNFTGQVRIPHDLVSKDRSSVGDEADSQRGVYPGQIPED